MNSAAFMKIIEFGHGTSLVVLPAKLLVEAKAFLGSCSTRNSSYFCDLSITLGIDALCSCSLLNSLANPTGVNYVLWG